MSNSPFHPITTRREFLKTGGAGIGLLAFSQVAPAFLTQSVRAEVPSAEKDRSILVLIQLAGGNDGLNTIVPFEDDQYYRLRPEIGLKGKDLIKIGDEHAFHASCPELAELFKEGDLSIVQNVGYPNPNRSHFRSMEIWETASESDDYLSTGWLGRYFDSCCAGAATEDPLAVNIGDELPDAFMAESDLNIFSFAGGRRKANSSNMKLLAALKKAGGSGGGAYGYLSHTLMNTLVTERRVHERLNAYRALADYPSHGLAQSLKQVAGLIASGQKTRVYFVSHSGFDTHANQVQRHSGLLRQLSSGMAAFQADLVAHGLEDQVMTMTFSEFGRRPNENESGGTDHGTAAPLFVMGSQVKGGLHGDAPDLNLGKNKDMAFSTDFRSVYGTVIDRWLESDRSKVLLGDFPWVNFL